MEYGADYSDKVIEAYLDAIRDDGEVQKYSIEVEGAGFADPPVIECVRFIQNPEDETRQERITRYCILNRSVNVKLDGQIVGSFRMNSMSDSWDAWPFFSEHPLALALIINDAAAFVVGKSKPRLKVPAKAVASEAGTRNTI